MTLILKDPDAALNYAIRWPDAVLDGAGISAASWSIEPDEPQGIAVSADFIDGSETGARFSGGLAGRVYRAACHITLTDGRSADRSLVVRLEQS
ncbi:hypothetical protein [Parasphingopyxis lamellibrachiae]|uniref:Uncharacterized protein n=1 Tax=Parasphingopyxis lamellibrachiae TaxID=680125 RepID=A0A3D9FG07_9SPHN|nr:hypothetical protein [Parasphingopyxis lamellibrachiae]RED16046.1 hypothetical protein DFR46_1057 [Parasphingopyxis lamellibrachiae]